MPGAGHLASARTLLVGGTGGLQTVTVDGDRLGRPAAAANPSSSGVYTVIDDERRHRLIVGWGDRVTGHGGGLQQLVAYRNSAVSIGTEGDLRVTDAATGTPLPPGLRGRGQSGETVLCGTVSR
ncbi:hypothetical protein ABZ801_15345 [Actinomadura sp. NPDC047616]|uniref:hypothetical protein n=1 Tax=Actinomadura sp. NPDC047616 TaxID=3155914 RepID=UPI0033E01C0E